jgi:hypothetical protein
MSGFAAARALPVSLRGDPGGDLGPGERQLLEAARRATLPGWAALIVLFSQFPAPGARPHHRRVARAILDDAAQRHGGQVFGLRNLDLVLLCPTATLRAPATSRANGTAGEAVPELLARLLRGETAEGVAPLLIWQLPDSRDRLLAFATERLAEGGLTPLDQAVAKAELPLGLTASAETRLLPDLLLRQTAVLLGAGGAQRIRPLFREITYATAALQAEAGTDGIDADPFLLRHFATRLEERVLASLPDEAGRRGALDLLGGPPLHLNLAPESVTTGAFATVVELCRSRGVGLGVEIALVDAAADPESYAAARAILSACGVACVIDHVSLLALRLARPMALAPDLVKLEWTPRLARLAPAELREIEAAFQEIGVERVLLMGADAEAPLQWGLTRGIRRFQGRHVDAMLAASRIATCSQASGCTLRQCIERSSAVAIGGRVGCRNTALLDAGAPGDAGPGHGGA